MSLLDPGLPATPVRAAPGRATHTRGICPAAALLQPEDLDHNHIGPKVPNLDEAKKALVQAGAGPRSRRVSSQREPHPVRRSTLLPRHPAPHESPTNADGRAAGSG